ncbi:MAG: TfoX/Sxy family protein [candidate division NC10 bacterium]|nr:TfoX/Sxy family protein [candidate division NC10 bacterium]
MAYDAALVKRIGNFLRRREGITQKRMFGGIAFMLRGHMCCGIVNNDLVIRVGPTRYEQALAQPHARPMDFTGRPLKGFVYVGPLGYRTDNALQKWVKQAVEFVASLPPKKDR